MKTKLLTAGLAILLIVTAFQTLRIERHKANYAWLEAEYAGYKEQQARAVLALNNSFIASLITVSEEARKQNEQIKQESDAAHTLALNDTNSMYQRQIARLRAACNTTTATGGKDASDPIGVLANVLTRTDEAAGVYARVADERGVALAACIRAYEAVRQ